MKSHTVPQKLLKQFAYFDSTTQSLRLWRYEKNREPFWKASPETSTAYDSFFADPENPDTELEIETQLAEQFENPVNLFLDKFEDEAFVMSDIERKLMTHYLMLLFWRSKGQREARKHYHQLTVNEVHRFISNESQFWTVVVHWNIQLSSKGRNETLHQTRDRVIRAANRLLDQYKTEIDRQQRYVETIQRWMKPELFDHIMYDGIWKIVRTSEDNPFIISDSPFVTWARDDDGQLSYGIGVREINVEVLLPVSPLTCLQILPTVIRNKIPQKPTVREINIAQAAFSNKWCFANILSDEINEIMQHNFGNAEIGVKAFSLAHRDYSNTIFELLMNAPI